jgi:hypothetical protein
MMGDKTIWIDLLLNLHQQKLQEFRGDLRNVYRLPHLFSIIANYRHNILPDKLGGISFQDPLKNSINGEIEEYCMQLTHDRFNMHVYPNRLYSPLC